MVPRKPKARSPRPPASLAEEASAAAARLAAGVPRIASGFFGRSRASMVRRVLLSCYVAALLLTGAAIYLKPSYCSLKDLYRNVRSGNVTVAAAVAWPKFGASSQAASEDSLDDRLYPPIVAGPKKYLLYRMIGNDMPPLQCGGQLYLNTKYTLEHETRELPECRKLWVLNHVVNATMRAYFEDLLVSHGYSIDDILVRRIDYAALTKADKGNWTNLVTAQNAARNFILEHGKRQAGARWILPFDGNQFVTDEAWDNLRRAADEHERNGLQYFKVPMYRLYHEQKPAWMFAGTPFSTLKDKAPFMWESQMAFRNDSTELYHEGLMYAKDNKLELIDRVCGTAKFDPKKKGKEGEGPSPEDRKRCGCHREVGNDRKVRPFSPGVAARCGYTVRLWYFPCKGVRTSILFANPKYRKKLREEGHAALQKEIEGEAGRWAAEREEREKIREKLEAAEALAAQQAAEEGARKANKKKKKKKGKKKKKAADEEE